MEPIGHNPKIIRPFAPDLETSKPSAFLTFKNHYPFVYLAAVCCLLLLPASCSQAPGNKKYDPHKVNFTVQYNPLFDNQLYPSLILGLNQNSSSNLNTNLFTLSCTVTAPTDNALLQITIDSSSLNYVTVFQEILPEKGQTYTFLPLIKWKYDRLRNLHQPSSIDLTVSCHINDEPIDIKNLHLNTRTVNECPLSFRLDNQIIDTRWLFAAYVNEDHPSIPDILSSILDQGIVSRLSGYQSGKAKDVSDQVLAVWYYALDQGISYASISCTSNPSPNTNVQHIRFFQQVLNTRQANCIDACVFFASILRKIGLRPLIFVEPCHAYLGYYTDSKQRNVALLETTVTSWVNFPQLQRSLLPDGTLPEEQLQTVARYLTPQQLQDHRDGKLPFDQLKILIAKSLFEKATLYNRDTYNANRTLFADSSTINYQLLDIEKLRQSVLPIN